MSRWGEGEFERQERDDTISEPSGFTKICAIDETWPKVNGLAFKPCAGSTGLRLASGSVRCKLAGGDWEATPLNNTSAFELAQPGGQQGGYLLWLFVGGEVAGVGEQMKLAAAGRGVEGLHLNRGDCGIFSTGDC